MADKDDIEPDVVMGVAGRALPAAAAAMEYGEDTDSAHGYAESALKVAKGTRFGNAAEDWFGHLPTVTRGVGNFLGNAAGALASANEAKDAVNAVYAGNPGGVAAHIGGALAPWAGGAGIVASPVLDAANTLSKTSTDKLVGQPMMTASGIMMPTPDFGGGAARGVMAMGGGEGAQNLARFGGDMLTRGVSVPRLVGQSVVDTGHNFANGVSDLYHGAINGISNAVTSTVGGAINRAFAASTPQAPSVTDMNARPLATPTPPSQPSPAGPGQGQNVSAAPRAGNSYSNMQGA